ncbi:MAG: hypothetical protein U0263_34890 [Polyangiaceae bacterium]
MPRSQNATLFAPWTSRHSLAEEDTSSPTVAAMLRFKSTGFSATGGLEQ